MVSDKCDDTLDEFPYEYKGKLSLSAQAESVVIHSRPTRHLTAAMPEETDRQGFFGEKVQFYFLHNFHSFARNSKVITP